MQRLHGSGPVRFVASGFRHGVSFAAAWLVGSLLWQPVAAAEVTIGEGGGFEIRSGERSFSVGGRLRLDGAYFDEDVTGFPAGIEANQALLMLQGRMSNEWGFALAYEFVGEQPFNAYIERTGLPIGDLRIGQFRPQVGLFPGGAWIAFNHRSVVEQALTLQRLVGIGLNGTSGRVAYSASVSGDQIGRDSEGDDPLRIAGRVAVRVGPDSQAPMQLGLSLVQRQTDDRREASFSADFGAQMADTPTLLEADQPFADHYRLAVLEGLWMRGPLSLQGEYMHAEVEAPGNPRIDGYYAQAVYFLTGDTRRYAADTATIGRPMLKDAARGAWEVGLRYEQLDLQQVGGGEASNIAVAINRYFSNPLRLTTTITRADIENGVNGDEQVISYHLRLQWFL